MKMIDEYNTDLPLPKEVDQDALNKFIESYPDIEFRIRTVLVCPRRPEVWIDLRRDGAWYRHEMGIIMRRAISCDLLACVTDPTAYIIELLNRAVLEIREEATK